MYFVPPIRLYMLLTFNEKYTYITTFQLYNKEADFRTNDTYVTTDYLYIFSSLGQEKSQRAKWAAAHVPELIFFVVARRNRILRWQDC